MDFKLRKDSEYIELIGLLKAVNLASSGGEAKMLVGENKVKVNGSVEKRKRAKLRVGDTVEVLGEVFTIR